MVEDKERSAQKELVPSKENPKDKEGLLDALEGDDGNVTLVVEEKEKSAHKELIPPKRKPKDEERSRMVGKMVEIMIIAGMENHVYKFNNVIRKQSQGGPIGLALTGEVADCYMVDWDQKFLLKMKSVGLNLIIYLRFKDDITIDTKGLERGTRFIEGKLVIDEDKRREDMEKSDEKVTMEVICSIANSIDEMMKFTVDSPENHENEMLPILDVQVKIKKQENN